MNCNICNNKTEQVFTKTILNKYLCNYYTCKTCGFMQTSEPVWLTEAYQSAITSLDIGLLNRNLRMLQIVPSVLDACFPEAKNMLDYAGGYGVFVRFMRDEGFNFFRHDPYCENLFARHFDLKDSELNKFDFVTAFEVFEHFKDPVPEIEKLFTYSDNVLFSTELLPQNSSEIENWWYLSTETGQHISFYSRQTLQYLATKHQKNYYFSGNGLHLFTPVKLSANQLDYAFNGSDGKPRLLGRFKKPYNFKKSRESLISSDYQYIKQKLNRL